MVLIIDASNIRSGGGLTHLKELLKNGDPCKFGIEKVIVWSSLSTLNKLPNKDWLEKKTHSWLNKSTFFSFLFQMLLISSKATKDKGYLIFVPGGTFLGSFNKIVSMSQNMLPFEKEEINRFDSSLIRLKFRFLRLTQKFTFERSKAVIFLTQYALNNIQNSVNLKNETVIIPHGINLSFLQEPKIQNELDYYSFKNPFKLLYVSIVSAYKHQWNVAQAVINLRRKGYPISLDLVGGEGERKSIIKLENVLKKDVYKCVKFRGLVEHDKLSHIYKNADGFVFASSCENQPIILIEAMTSGLPIISSNKGPMSEVIGEFGLFFDPTSIESIENSIVELLNNKQKRSVLSQKTYQKSLNYTWKDCSNRTFEFLSQVN